MPFHFGATLTPELANYSPAQTTDVASFPPNAWGLHDMHGNVQEWCLDFWHDSYKGAPADGSAWTAGGGTSRLLRGGSWGSFPRHCRSAFRDFALPDDCDDYIGFRVCTALKAEPEVLNAADLLPVEPPEISKTMAMQYRSAWREGLEDGWSEARAVLARWRHPHAAAPEPGENLATPPAPEPGEVARLTFQDAILLAQGCHDYSGGHTGAEREAWHSAIDTVVDALKLAAAGPWDSQTRAVFGVGVEAGKVPAA
jgi:hypothetical protein